MSLSAPEIEEQYGQFDQAYSLEWCLALTGRKPDLNVEPILERWAQLFTAEAIQVVTQAEARVSLVDRRRWRRLALGLTDKHIMCRVAAVEQALHTARRTVTVDVDGQALPILQLPLVVSSEADPVRRQQLTSAWRTVQLREISPLGLQLWQARHRAAWDLGYRSYAAVYLHLKELRRDRIQQRARCVLANTQKAYGAVAHDVLSGKVRQIYLARMAAGHALHDFHMDGDPHETAAQAYVDCMQHATGVIHHPAPYSLGDDELYAAGYLEAFSLHQHLLQGLKRRFGVDWWQCREVGEWLRSQIWRRGMDWSAEEFTAACGTPFSA